MNLFVPKREHMYPKGNRETWRIKMKYYYLKKGDIIKGGDEIDACNDAWRDEPKWKKAKTCIGEPAPDPQYISHRNYRRKISWLSRLLNQTTK